MLGDRSAVTRSPGGCPIPALLPFHQLRLKSRTTNEEPNRPYLAATDQSGIQFLAGCVASGSGMGTRVLSRVGPGGASRSGRRLRATTLCAAMDEYHRALFVTRHCRGRRLGHPIFVSDIQKSRQTPLIAAPITRPWKWALLALCCCLFGMASCGPRSGREKWIIPQNYVGWLRLDYAVAGAPPLPMENGAFVVRMPPGGRLETSSALSGSIDENEYFVVTNDRLQKLVLSQARMARGQTPIQEYAVQSAFGLYKIDAGVIQKQLKCIFVGTRPDFRTQWQDCEEWQAGQPRPPESNRHMVLHEPGDPARK
jgi:hypothetical protein